jgi:hypothetical protein
MSNMIQSDKMYKIFLNNFFYFHPDSFTELAAAEAKAVSLGFECTVVRQAGDADLITRVSEVSPLRGINRFNEFC